MANNKSGLNFYSTDTDRYLDIRIKRLKNNMGCSGIAVYDYLLCSIYRESGSFIEWDENTICDVADYFSLKESLVIEIVNYCAHVGLFNKELLRREKVLSSLSIQERYVDWCTKAKRKKIKIPEEYKIIPEESAKIQEECTVTPEVCREERKEERKEVNSPPENPLHGSNLFRKPNIPSFEDVHRTFVQNGGSLEMAKKFFETNEGTGWYYRGSPVTNYTNLVHGFISSWKRISRDSPEGDGVKRMVI